MDPCIRGVVDGRRQYGQKCARLGLLSSFNLYTHSQLSLDFDIQSWYKYLYRQRNLNRNLPLRQSSPPTTKAPTQNSQSKSPLFFCDTLGKKFLKDHLFAQSSRKFQRKLTSKNWGEWKVCSFFLQFFSKIKQNICPVSFLGLRNQKLVTFCFDLVYFIETNVAQEMMAEGMDGRMS